MFRWYMKLMASIYFLNFFPSLSEMYVVETRRVFTKFIFFLLPYWPSHSPFVHFFLLFFILRLCWDYHLQGHKRKPVLSALFPTPPQPDSTPRSSDPGWDLETNGCRCWRHFEICPVFISHPFPVSHCFPASDAQRSGHFDV